MVSIAFFSSLLFSSLLFSSLLFSSLLDLREHQTQPCSTFLKGIHFVVFLEHCTGFLGAPYCIHLASGRCELRAAREHREHLTPLLSIVDTHRHTNMYTATLTPQCTNNTQHACPALTSHTYVHTQLHMCEKPTDMNT